MRLDEFAEFLFGRLEGAKALLLVDATKTARLYFNPDLPISPQEENIICIVAWKRVLVIQEHGILRPNRAVGLVFREIKPSKLIAMNLDSQFYGNESVSVRLSYGEEELSWDFPL
jgi:hypothetical protein